VLTDLGIALYNLDRNADAAKYLPKGGPESRAGGNAFSFDFDASAQNDIRIGARIQTCAERDPKNPNYHFFWRVNIRD